MAKFKSWSYPKDNAYVAKFEELFESIDNKCINKWYSINKNVFIYENDNFFYHMAEVKKNQLGYYIEDHILNKKGELKYNKDYGYFKEKNELLDFIKIKVA
jgi:hypothetical protein